MLLLGMSWHKPLNGTKRKLECYNMIAIGKTRVPRLPNKGAEVKPDIT